MSWTEILSSHQWVWILTSKSKELKNPLMTIVLRVIDKLLIQKEVYCLMKYLKSIGCYLKLTLFIRYFKVYKTLCVRHLNEAF